MLNKSQVWKTFAVSLLVFLVTAVSTTLAADVQCRFKAESETTEVHIMKDGKTQWAGSIEKLETKVIPIPEGPFTVISRVYNPNLKNKEDVRSDSHTRLCREQTLTVPLFSESKDR
jgi:hypothetical protein